MQYGFILPGGDVESIPQLTVEAEEAGWDGVFIADCISIDTPGYALGSYYDPWILLALMATRTKRVRIGPMVAAISRRRPWKLARETMTIDHISQGRLILAVGLGAAQDDPGFYRVGEVMELKKRAKLMDECLEILTGLWSGERFSYDGEHYHINELVLQPAPVQQPHIPIWVVGQWPAMKSMRRTLRYDGLVPQAKSGTLTPADLVAIKQFITENRTLTTPFDIITEGETPANDPEQARMIVQPWLEAGATWWLESRWTTQDQDVVRERIRQGPPRLV